MVGRSSDGASALEAGRSERHVCVERPEEAFDKVDFVYPCPNCGTLVDGFRTKDLCRQQDTVDFRVAYHFYAECRCGAWIDFIRKPAAGIDDFDTRVEAD